MSMQDPLGDNYTQYVVKGRNRTGEDVHLGTGGNRDRNGRLRDLAYDFMPLDELEHDDERSPRGDGGPGDAAAIVAAVAVVAAGAAVAVHESDRIKGFIRNRLVTPIGSRLGVRAPQREEREYDPWTAESEGPVSRGTGTALPD